MSDKVPMLNVGLIQFDLTGHSALASAVEEKGSRLAFFLARKELFENLRKTAGEEGVNLHHWAGDGGLFVAELGFANDAARIYKTAESIYDCFVAWQKKHALCAVLACRVTATFIPDVYGDREPGNWFSPKLNEFLKYEREIGRSGCITYLQELQKHIVQDPTMSELPARTVHLSNGNSLTVYRKRMQPSAPIGQPNSFKHWLIENAGKLPTIKPSVPTGTLPAHACQIGDATILDMASDRGGYRPIHLDTHSDRTAEDIHGILTPEDEDDWRARSEKMRAERMDGTKFSVREISFELLDDQTRIRGTLVRFPEAKAFHDLLQTKPDATMRYWSEAMGVVGKGTRLPGILCNHVLVVLGAGSKRKLLLAHRRKRQNTYSANCWSVSFEEQFNPVAMEINGQKTEQDLSILQGISRGLREEFLGADSGQEIKPQVQALQMETRLLNFGFLSLVELSDLNFGQLCQLWPHADDWREHDCLAALPLDARLIRQCLESPSLPLLPEIEYSAGFGTLQPSDHGWHPTSKARLVLALWLAEQRGG